MVKNKSIGFVEALTHNFWNVVSSLDHLILLSFACLNLRFFLFLFIFNNDWLIHFLFFLNLSFRDFNFLFHLCFRLRNFNFLLHLCFRLRDFDFLFNFFSSSASVPVVVLKLMGKMLEIFSAFWECSSRLFRYMFRKQACESINALVDALVKAWERDPFTIDLQGFICIINNSENLDWSLMKVLNF